MLNASRKQKIIDNELGKKKLKVENTKESEEPKDCDLSLEKNEDEQNLNEDNYTFNNNSNEEIPFCMSSTSGKWHTGYLTFCIKFHD